MQTGETNTFRGRRILVGLFVTAAAAATAAAQEVSQSGLELVSPRPMISQAERAPHAMVASVHELATKAGLEVLKKGGNAVDAAVAVAFALAVVHPEAGNLGGGGYMLVRMADGRAKTIDYRETAPASSHEKMFANREEMRVGYKASATPGTVAGMAMAHAMFGKLSWRQVLEPARRLAKLGFPVSQRIELILGLQVPVMKNFPESAKLFLPNGTALKQGTLLKQTDLARTIERIQKNGAGEFYTGETGKRIAADMAANNGTIRGADLAAYKPIARDPIEGTYRGNRVLTMGPSSSGGLALIEMLNIFERFPAALGMEGSTAVRHLQIEAMRRAYRDRSVHVGDPAFTTVPVEMLLSKAHAEDVARNIRTDRATNNAELGARAATATDDAFGYESEDTTHFAIIDNDGNLVTNTYTLNSFFGSQVVIKGTGVLMNDIMSGFVMRPGAANSIAPNKRPMSSMTPTIVLHADGKPWFALGSPGAATIPNTVFAVVTNIIDFKMPLRDAIEYPRIHHQFTPDRIDAEPGALVFDVGEKLKAMGHTVNPKLRSQGDVHAVMLEETTGKRLGWSDGRRGGHAAGY